MKELDGHLYETHPDWYPVIVRKCPDWRDELIYKGTWLSEHCPNCDEDYDAYSYHGDDFASDPNHRTAYFFRDEVVALMFALKWG